MLSILILAISTLSIYVRCLSLQVPAEAAVKKEVLLEEIRQAELLQVRLITINESILSPIIM